MTSQINTVKSAKREFKNILRRTKFSEYNNSTFKPIKYRVEILNFEIDESTKLQSLLIKLLESINNISTPDEQIWEETKEYIIQENSIVDPSVRPYGQTSLGSTIARIWNGLLAFQYHIEEQTIPKNVNI